MLLTKTKRYPFSTCPPYLRGNPKDLPPTPCTSCRFQCPVLTSSFMIVHWLYCSRILQGVDFLHVSRLCFVFSQIHPGGKLFFPFISFIPIHFFSRSRSRSSDPVRLWRHSLNRDDQIPPPVCSLHWFLPVK
ncbi:hypothetical protein CVT26_003874 [Gymnopilus dilepis]|uniref:Uncharacterized protein n=1 Tax=Gymnopilus dilepis TaxID=231916 RepID=A0A409WYF1_9AGAR|nr:hypothetical protein CVT26_003874 [Gymnopilus dilepis]